MWCARVADSSEVRLWLLLVCQAAAGQSCITSTTTQPK